MLGGICDDLRQFPGQVQDVFGQADFGVELGVGAAVIEPAFDVVAMLANPFAPGAAVTGSGAAAGFG